MTAPPASITEPDAPRVDDRLLDLLVDGELDDGRRAELFRALDADPQGWKRCALTFLEAQAWGDGLQTAARPAAAPRSVTSRRLPVVRRFASIAAAIVVAFLTGLIARDAARPQSYARDPGPERPAKISDTLPVAMTSDGGDAGAVAPATLPEYVRRQLERQGYEVQGDRKMMSVALKDGRQVTVPVETYKYRFVGHKIY
jgi:hypothetical protein